MLVWQQRENIENMLNFFYSQEKTAKFRVFGIIATQIDRVANKRSVQFVEDYYYWKLLSKDKNENSKGFNAIGKNLDGL